MAEIWHCAQSWEKSSEKGLQFCETSLLRRLQAQTLQDTTPPVGKIHPFGKIPITFEALILMPFWI
jgi:hypothetical protein